MNNIWTVLRDGSLLGRLEGVIAVALSLVVALVAVLALARLAMTAFDVLLSLDRIADYESYRTLFAMVFTVLVALELNNSIIRALTERHSIVLVKGVILIGIMTMVRKLLLLDATKTSGGHLAGLAAVVLSLAVLYFVVARWPMRETDREDEPLG